MHAASDNYVLNYHCVGMVIVLIPVAQAPAPVTFSPRKEPTRSPSGRPSMIQCLASASAQSGATPAPCWIPANRRSERTDHVVSSLTKIRLILP